MKYLKLDGAGLKVSRLCLGTNNFGTQVDSETAIRIVKKAIDLGINAIDTADVYTQGKSERIIGEAIRGVNRDELIIATKVGSSGNFGRGDVIDLSRRHILSQVEESLRRLRTDRVDIYYLHYADPRTPLEETLRAMDYLVKEGKVGYAACSNFTFAQIKEMNVVCEKLGLARLAVVSPQYNLIQREIEKELLPYCQEKRIGVLTYSPLIGGFMTGKYKEDERPPPGSRGAAIPSYFESRKEMYGSKRLFSMADRLRAIADGAKIPPHNLALAWVLKNPAVAAVVVGASKPEQVEDNCRLVEMSFPKGILERLDEMT